VIDFERIEGFGWDGGNRFKSEGKHGVGWAEAEQIFFDDPLLIVADPKHSESESRFHALGKTVVGRLLHVTFTLRDGGRRIRIISARDMHRKEKQIHEAQNP
jgi:uncharacterized DUF497 family protein